MVLHVERQAYRGCKAWQMERPHESFLATESGGLPCARRFRPQITKNRAGTFDSALGFSHKYSRRIPDNCRIRRHILCHNAARAHKRPFSNGHATEDCHTSSYRRSFPYYSSFESPVGLCLKFPVGINCTWKSVIYEGHIVPDKDTVLDIYPFANEGMARYLAVLSNSSVFLNFNEGSHLRVVAYLATISVNEAEYFHVRADSHINERAPWTIFIQDLHWIVMPITRRRGS
jgi:hypothetical protein